MALAAIHIISGLEGKSKIPSLGHRAFVIQDKTLAFASLLLSVDPSQCRSAQSALYISPINSRDKLKLDCY